MFGYVILAFILYFLYRFIVGFLLPIWKTTKNVRETVRNVKQQYGEPEGHMNTNAATDEKIKTFTEKAGDYIDFEEVKE